MLYLPLMQKYNHIKAIFFLGIFSIFLLHQIVPHLHHEHEIAKTILAHSEGDHHNHHDTPEENKSSKKGLMDFFLGMHVHVAVSDEIPVIRELTKKLRQVDNVVSDIPALYNNIILKDYTEVQKPAVYRPPNNYFNPYTANLDVRGPPYLG